MKRTKLRSILFIVIAGCLLPAQLVAQSDVPESVLANGGGESSNDQYRILGTAGQPAIGRGGNISFLSKAGYRAAPAPAALDIPTDIQTVAAWMIDLQYTDPNLPSNGGFKKHHDPGLAGGYFDVNPYFSNLGLVGMLQAPVEGKLEAAERWIDWYLDHLNMNSTPPGVVYDHWYLADGTGETTAPPGCGTNEPGIPDCNWDDASDSYAATFLGATWVYYEAGGRADFLKEPGKKEKFETIAEVILALQDVDGLVWAKDGYRVKYVMDNSEVFWGLKSMANLEAFVFDDPNKAQIYEAAAEKVRNAIETELFNQNTQLYRGAKFENGTFQEVDLDVWYSDTVVGTVALVWPHLFGVERGNSTRAQTQMAALNNSWDGSPNPDWTGNIVDPDGFPWPAIGYASLLIGGNSQARAHATFVKQQKLADFGYPLTVFDAGFFLRTLSPTANAQSVATVEDTDQQIALSGNHLGEDGLMFAIARQPAKGSVSLSGVTVTYRPDPDFNGADHFTFTAGDGSSTSSPVAVTITVNAVNDAPSFTRGADHTVDEDGGAQTVSGWATGISAGPGDESGQAPDFTVSSDNPGLFSIQPAVDALGTLTYTPAANASGSATVSVQLKDNGGTANGGVDLSPIQTFTVTVRPVNDRPTLTANNGLSLSEKKTAILTAAQLQATDMDNDVAQLTYTVVTPPTWGILKRGESTLGVGSTFVQADIDGGHLTFTHTGSDATSDRFTFRVSDGSGETTGDTVFLLNITPVDRPIAHATSAETMEDVALQIPLAGSDPEGKPLTFALVRRGASGTMVLNGAAATYTPYADFNGSDSFTFMVDNGTFTSDTARVAITVNAVNDAPSFTKGADHTVDEDGDAQTVSGWATGISAGPGDESGQAPDFTVSSDNPGLFSIQPAVDALGTLTYTPAANASGSATVSVQLKDNGGTANGGVDLSPIQTFTVTVRPVNDRPTLADIGSQSTGEDSSLTDIAFTVDEGDGASEDAQTLTVTATSSNTTLVPDGNITVNYTADGTADATGGTLDITPAADQSGTTTIAVTVDDGQSADGTVSKTFTLTVSSVNDDPILVTNQRLAVGERGTASITSDLLKISDVDNSAAQLTYTIGAAPTKGELQKASTKLGSGSTFTQDDIDNNRVSYVHTGNGTISDSFTFAVSDDAGGSIGSTSFAITITSVDRPIANPASETTQEDSTLQITLTGSDPEGKSLTFAKASDPSNGTMSLSNNTATYTPYADFNGSDSFTFTVDNGTFTSSPVAVTITVNAVNDAPSFTRGADHTVDEDGGAQTVSGWATGISAGPGDESGQAPDFTVSSDNPGLFSIQPAVDALGTLTYTPAANASGSATVSVQLKDNGGTANGGVDLSPIQTFTVTVRPVNDRPTLDGLTDQTIQEDSQPTEVAFTVDEGGGPTRMSRA